MKRQMARILWIFFLIVMISVLADQSDDRALSEKEANVINCNISDERILPRNIVFRDLARSLDKLSL